MMATPWRNSGDEDELNYAGASSHCEVRPMVYLYWMLIKGAAPLEGHNMVMDHHDLLGH